MQKLILLVALILMPMIGFAGDDKKEAEEGPVIEYIEMTPKFTVNLAEPKKYLLVKVQLLVEGAENVEKIKKNMPMLRHEIILMLSGIPRADLETMEQREALRVKTKDLITEALAKTKNSDGFRDIFFSEFLVN
ncbi:flagellar basal body protein FliL [Methylomonas lenta]|uniref:Flagellar protein FliL n=1 Tax=Methylomonas lenta TaxID=980561 RepID=A0A177MY06_9GAMM|nr:flagellar basal body-associated FliL family protein [Methylomonas lenta]OAI10586.1 flagellar basal body protein FliL [Methylomonas lenta]